jgi:MFS family permease
MLVVAAQLGTNFLVPRLGPKIMVPAGMVIGVVGMVLLTSLDASSTYAGNVLVPLMIIGTAMGTIMPASMQTATLGVDRQFAGVASAMVNTSQQVGGSVGTALLNTLAATATADYLVAHAPVTQAVGVDAALAGYGTAYWWGAGFFAFGAVLAALLFRRRSQGLSLTNAHAPAAQSDAEPALSVG